MEKISDTHPLGLRMPSELKAWIKKSAKQNQRSMNSEIVFILEKEKALRAVTPKASDVNTHDSI